ncbi:MAG: hypothetical protein ACOYKE_13060 [Ferruginibacter sp.]
MKKIALSLIAITTLFLASNAQELRKNQEKRKGNRQEMMQKMQFTDAQKASMKANREAFKKSVADLEKNDKITLKDYRNQKAELQKAMKEKNKGLLTPEQNNQIEQAKATKKAEHEKRAAAHLDRMKQQLNLSEAQANQIKSNRAEMQQQRAAIKNNESLSVTEKKEKMMALKSKQKASFRQVLNKEQQDKLAEMKKHRAEKKSPKASK